MATFWNKAKETAMDILFPPICITCGLALKAAEKKNSLCESCFKRILIASSLTCPECGARFAKNIKICHRDASYRLAAASSYENERLKRLLWILKYEKKTAAAEPIGELLHRHLKLLTLNFSGFRVVPIPLHRSRERERGFNQSLLIAQSLSRRTGLETETAALRRIKSAPPQAEAKNFETRIKNMTGSFEVAHPELVKNRQIILIDDVFTSGATMGAAVKTLKIAGAKRVIALVAAKAG